MPTGWVDFGDWCLNQRLNTMVTKLSQNPERTLLESMGVWSETKAAYRFFDNKKFEVSAINVKNNRKKAEKSNPDFSFFSDYFSLRSSPVVSGMSLRSKSTKRAKIVATSARVAMPDGS